VITFDLLERADTIILLLMFIKESNLHNQLQFPLHITSSIAVV